MPVLTVDDINKYSGIDVKIFVETGTCIGDTLFNVLPRFDKLYSVELKHELYLKSCERFSGKTNVMLHEGNSEDFLNKVCPDLDQPTFFWLDAHWSGSDHTARGSRDVPLIEELAIIVEKCPVQCVVCIDDMRLLGVKAGEDWSYVTESKILDTLRPRLARDPIIIPSHLSSRDVGFYLLRSL